MDVVAYVFLAVISLTTGIGALNYKHAKPLEVNHKVIEGSIGLNLLEAIATAILWRHSHFENRLLVAALLWVSQLYFIIQMIIRWEHTETPTQRRAITHVTWAAWSFIAISLLVFA